MSTDSGYQAVLDWYLEQLDELDWEVQTEDDQEGVVYAYEEEKTYRFDFNGLRSGSTYELKVTWDED